MKPLIIYGSSHSAGVTKEISDLLVEGYNHSFVDLNTKNISYYDYEHKNKDDDFIEVAHQMLEHETIVFVTPVYWYTMSAQLKVFFDRLTDLITIHKSLGRALKGKKVFLVSTGHGAEYPESLEYPVKSTAEYFGMEYGGLLYFSTKQEKASSDAIVAATKKFRRKIFNL